MIILFTVASLMGIRGADAIYNESSRQRSIVRAVQTVTEAEEVIIRETSRIAKAAAAQQYDQISALVKSGDGNRLSESELDEYFRKGYSNKIENELGSDAVKLCETLNSFLDTEGLKNVSVVTNQESGLFRDEDAKGNTTALRIKNITIEYSDPVSGERTDNINFNIQFPETVFHAGNDDLFRYCMVARKGIYMTGRTSSVIGDVFAGKHSADECREAEISYGETGTYGGLNILTTQLGIRADMVVSEGDININGSFVNFQPVEDKLACYGQRMNEIEGFSQDASYTLDGLFIPTYRMDDVNRSIYNDNVRMADTAVSKLGGIEIYYDSNNDGGYTSKYRKLMSTTDIEIRDDFTGIVATPANVIIHNDVNVEGTIVCGDRIYTMGNNNIVADPGIARAIIAEEMAGGYGYRVSDFIGGMRDVGMLDPQYYVIPYRL